MREGSDGSSNAQEKIVVLRLAVWEKSEFVTRGPSKLAKQPNNHNTVAHIINPGKITRFVHAIDLAWQSILLTKDSEIAMWMLPHSTHTRGREDILLWSKTYCAAYSIALCCFVLEYSYWPSIGAVLYWPLHGVFVHFASLVRASPPLMV